MENNSKSAKPRAQDCVLKSLSNCSSNSDSATSETSNHITPNLSTAGDKDEETNCSLSSYPYDSLKSVPASSWSSSSPTVSPNGRILGKNANGTTIPICIPKNEAEMQLYNVLQRASLLAYFDTFLDMGGDDLSQLYEAGEEEFLEIMALVGMSSKPLHVRRLQKVLHEWASNPAIFQGQASRGLHETANCYHEDRHLPKKRYSVGQLPLQSVPQTLVGNNSFITYQISNLASLTGQVHSTGSTGQQVSSSSSQVTPLLSEYQVSLLAKGAESIAEHLPQREPRPQSSKKRTSRELDQVIAMSVTDPMRMEKIRKYSAIYGRFDCKRRPEKPLTFHEVCVNEAAAQLCKLVPTLLTWRDELFPLARKVVRNVGFGYSANVPRHSNMSEDFQTDPQPVLNQESESTISIGCSKRSRSLHFEDVTKAAQSRLPKNVDEGDEKQGSCLT